MTDMTIDWGPLNAEAAPHRLPMIFQGSALIVYGFLPPTAEAGDVVLTGMTGYGRF